MGKTNNEDNVNKLIDEKLGMDNFRKAFGISSKKAKALQAVASKISASKTLIKKLKNPKNKK